MHFLSSLMFGVSSNMDNLIVGLSYGIKKRRIGWTENLLVAFISSIGTVLSMVLGKSLLLILPGSIATVLGSLIIIGIGIAGLLHYLKSKCSGGGCETQLHTLSIRESLLLGIALTINNIGLGIGASITGLSVIPTAISSLLFSLLFLYAGNRIGHARLSNAVGKFAEPAASLLMIALGIYELFI